MSLVQRKKLEHNMLEKFSYLAKQDETMTFISNEQAIIINSHLACDMFNIIARVSVSSNTEFSKILDYFKKQHLPFALWVGFIDEPTQLRDCLANITLPTVESEVGMVADLNNLKVPRLNQALDIKPVTSLEHINHIIAVMSALLPEEQRVLECYFHKVSHHLIESQSKLKFFVGYLNGKAVATSSLYLDTLSAGIWDIISVPEIRGQGVGTTMTYAAMVAAASEGHSEVVLTASDDGFPIYEKIGFKVVSRYNVYNFPNEGL